MVNNYKVGSYAYIAIKDFHTAEVLLNNGIYDAATVSMQQSIEKMCKAYIQNNKIDIAELKGSHNLYRLLHVVDSVLAQKYKGDLFDLKDAYYDTRYPGIDYREIDCALASKLMTVTEDVMIAINKKLGN